jgi:hypothetical protein
MTVSRLPVVAVNGPVEINCINATAALSGAGSEISCYAWSTADGAFSGETNTINATAATAGTYILTVTKTATGCFDSKQLLLQNIY